MEGACILCDGVTSSASGMCGDDVIQRLTSLLQLSIIQFSDKHKDVCPKCEEKIAKVEAILSEMKRLYADIGKSYNIYLEDKTEKPCSKKRTVQSIGTQTELIRQAKTEKESTETKAKQRLKSTAPAPSPKCANSNTDQYACPVCEESFRMRASFRRHLKSHVATKFKCKNCSQSWPNIFDLCVHKEQCKGPSKEVELKTSAKDVQEGARRGRKREFQGGECSLIRKESPVKRKPRLKSGLDSVKSSDIVGQDPPMTTSAENKELDESSEDLKKVESLLQNGIKIEVKEIDFDLSDAGNDVDVSECNLDSGENSSIQKSEIVNLNLLQNECDWDKGADTEGVMLIVGEDKSRKSKRNQTKAKCKFTCEVCSKQFAFLQSLQRHEKTVHNNERPYACDQCEQTFKWAQSLKTHKRMHSDERPYSCSQCDQSFRQAGTLKQHERSHKGQKVYSCKYCSAKFTRSMRLKIHQRSHTGERPYQCDECGIGFADPQIFKKHQMNHRGEKPYVCPDCGKAFVMARYLTEHRKRHTGEKAYLCATCGSAFANAGRLTRHMSVHTHSKKHQCQLCDKAFAYKEGLKAHVNIHMGLKPYSCKTCKKSFTHRTGLTQHQMVHTKDRQFTCHTCNHSFATLAKLRRHSTLHPNTIPENDCQIINLSPEAIEEVVPAVAAVVETEALQKLPLREGDNNQETSEKQGPCRDQTERADPDQIQEEVPPIAAVVETEGTKEQKETQRSSQSLLEVLTQSIGISKTHQQQPVPIPLPISVQTSTPMAVTQAVPVIRSQAFSQPASQSQPYSQPASQSQALSQPASQSQAFSQPASQSQALSQPASQSQAFSQPASQTQIFAKPASQSQAFALQASQSQTFSLATSQPQTFSQPASQSQTFSLATSQSQTFSLATSQSQTFSQAAQQQHSQQQTSQIMTMAALKSNTNQPISIAMPSQEQARSFAQTILPTTYTTLGVLPPVTSGAEYHMLPGGQNILYQAAGSGTEHQQHVQVIERVVNQEMGLTIMEIQVPRDSTPLTVQIQQQ